MARFIINRNAQETVAREHEVHNLDAINPCEHLPKTENRVPLGNFADCHAAIRAARVANPSLTIDGCFYCCPACHTR